MSGERRSACEDLVTKSEEKRPVRRPRHRWKDIKIVLRKVE